MLLFPLQSHSEALYVNAVAELAEESKTVVASLNGPPYWKRVCSLGYMLQQVRDVT